MTNRYHRYNNQENGSHILQTLPFHRYYYFYKLLHSIYGYLCLIVILDTRFMQLDEIAINVNIFFTVAKICI